MNLFKPYQILNIFTDFDADSYWDKGFRMVLLDIDNTIAIPNTGICDQRAEAFIQKLKDKGYKVVIFSNNNRQRVLNFIGDIDVDYVCYALKPLPFSFRSIASKHNLSTDKVLVLGDQLMTDILGANLSGCTGIYCKQLQVKDSFITSINRKIENFVWRHILHEKV